jgi:hypothetical protein
MIQLPRSAVDFIDFLRTLTEQTREEWFQSNIAANLRILVDDPSAIWNRKYLLGHFGLNSFLDDGDDD